MAVEGTWGLRQSVAYQFRRIYRPPWDIPANLAANATLMCAAWFLLPPRAHDWMLSTSTEHSRSRWSWHRGMLADTPATRRLGLRSPLGHLRREEPDGVLALVSGPLHCARNGGRGAGARWSHSSSAFAVIRGARSSGPARHRLLPLTCCRLRGAWLGILFPTIPPFAPLALGAPAELAGQSALGAVGFWTIVFVPAVGVAILAPSVVLSAGPWPGLNGG